MIQAKNSKNILRVQCVEITVRIILFELCKIWFMFLGGSRLTFLQLIGNARETLTLLGPTMVS
jgi:hypothetical protein